MNEVRNAEMRRMYLAGKTLREIGDTFGCTWQNVGRVINRFGLSRKDRPFVRKGDIVEALRDNNCRAQYGISLDERREIRSRFGRRPFRAFSEHKKNSRKRGIQFLMTFGEWWGIWQSSGKWALCGTKTGRFVMSRYGDEGPYSVGNVRIVSANDNHVEYNAIRRKIKMSSEVATGDVGA